jgi:SpoVK/Ycf46/Vps4 family AAA+-type ATPase
MYTEIIKIIEGGLKKDPKKVFSYAKLLAEKLLNDGEDKMAATIQSLINQKMVNTVSMDELLATPVDQESGMGIADVFIPTETTSIILPELLNTKVNGFINSIQHRKLLDSHGVTSSNTLLLYGMPGVGKTKIAQYISEKTGLPLVVARLDGIVSSLLGNTAKNVRKIFDFADSKPCILFLDEFDAIAKARDDQHELGELKRVINSLLQNIDAFASNNILIAATNHQELLDKAIWRRFNTVIEISPPSQEEIEKLLVLFFKNFKISFLDDKKKLEKAANLLLGKTPADIKTVVNKTITQSLIEEKKLIDFEDLAVHIFDFNTHGSYTIEDLIKYLNDNGIPQSQIAEKLAISIRQVRNNLNEK